MKTHALVFIAIAVCLAAFAVTPALAANNNGSGIAAPAPAGVVPVLKPVQQQIMQRLGSMDKAELIQIVGLLAPKMNRGDLLQALMNLNAQVTDPSVKDALSSAMRNLQSRTLSPQELQAMLNTLMLALNQVEQKYPLAVLATMLPQLGDGELRAVLAVLLDALQKTHQLPGLQRNIQGWLAQLPATAKPLDPQAIAELLKVGMAKANTSLETVNQNIMAVGDNLLNKAGNAGIEGSLVDGGNLGTGTYSFNVNLVSGAISNGAMRGDINNNAILYDLSRGTGLVSGNNFSVSNFQGSVTSGGLTFTDVSGSSLNGFASGGFSKLGDIGAAGTFNVRANGGAINEPGTITSGRRIR